MKILQVAFLLLFNYLDSLPKLDKRNLIIIGLNIVYFQRK